ncbi:hypothetical protein GCM10025331_85130 [Actinoplanes utahensis]|nr:hypothetical protein Aut01nite_58000 [Actinoplanes utahensis]
MHPSMLMDLADDRTRERIAEADRRRLLTRARRPRKKVTGTLASCEVSVAVPAR